MGQHDARSNLVSGDEKKGESGGKNKRLVEVERLAPPNLPFCSFCATSDVFFLTLLFVSSGAKLSPLKPTGAALQCRPRATSS